MTKEEFKAKIKAIQDNAESARRMAAVEYARLNNPVVVGDVVSDHSDTIRVENMQPYWMASEVPCMRYTGTILLKSGKPNKLGKKATVYQSGMSNHIKQ